MGSGKGKTRRTSASQPKLKVPVKPATAWRRNVPKNVRIAWKAFVTDNGLTDTSIAEYYGHDPAATGGIARVSYEILQDLVALGQVVLPPGATVDGLSPQISTGWHGETLELNGNVLVLTTRNPRARRRKAIVDDEPYTRLTKETKMGSLESLYLAAALAHAVNALFSLQEDPDLLTQF
jgi:hypothetical protein